eukprot:7360681-Alexandrium_andersonii.AAC.1
MLPVTGVNQKRIIRNAETETETQSETETRSENRIPKRKQIRSRLLRPETGSYGRFLGRMGGSRLLRRFGLRFGFRF